MPRRMRGRGIQEKGGYKTSAGYVSLNKLTKTQLNRFINAEIANIDALKNNKDYISREDKSYLLKVEEASRTFTSLYNSISSIRYDIQQTERKINGYPEIIDDLHRKKQSILTAIFVSKNTVNYYEEGLKLAKSRIGLLTAEFHTKMEKYNELKPIYDAYKINFEIEKSEREISSLNNRLQLLLQKEAKTLSLKNKASANTKQKRDIASRIKKQLAQFSNCPYCFGPIGENPHADHIYPVSKGGESVPKNMVFVCSSCNSNKGDKTLTAFIKKYKLDREKIENELDLLGKEY